MASGKAITLKYQHEHLEDSVLVYSCAECSVYLIASTDGAHRSFVKLTFQGVQCVRSASTDCTPAMGIFPEPPGASFIAEITDTRWPEEARKAYVYATSSRAPSGRHFVVSNHDIFHEILAESFTESLVGPSDAGYHEISGHFGR